MRVEEVADLAQHGEQTAGAVEVVHQDAASGLQVDQHAARATRSGRSRRGSGRCRAARRWPASGRRRWSSRRSRPARRSRCGTRPSSGRCSVAGLRRSSRPPAVRCRGRPPAGRLSGAGVPATPGRRCRAPRPRSAIVDAVPIVLQCPRLRIIADSDGGTAPATACRRGPPRTAARRRCRSRAARRGTCR